MGCLLLISAFAGPRIGIILWWLIDMDRWETAFEETIWPLLGFIFFPWTILAWVAVAPTGNPSDSDYIWIAIAFAIDMVSWASNMAKRYSM